MQVNVRELAVEIDTILAGLYDGEFFHAQMLAALEDRVRYEAGQTREEFRERRFGPVTYGPWSGTLDEALAAIDPANRYADQYRHHAAQLAQIKVEQAEANEVYREYLWTRAFLVINANGHVHTGMDCSTCFSTTRYEWLTHYSGADEAEIVSDAGETACTVCYPSAPAEVLNRPANLVSRTRQEKDEAKAQRAAEKAEREAKKLAKAATLTGEPLVLPVVHADRTERIETEATARREWNAARDYEAWGYYTDRVEVIRERQSLIEAALAEKHSTTPEAIREDLLKRYAKRRTN